MKSICLFVKAPVAGRVKTRLMPAIGARACADLYQAMAEDTFAVASQVPDTSVSVAYEASPDFPAPDWLPGVRAWFPQEGAGLGDRLSQAVRVAFAAGAGPLLVIGSDLPSLTTELLGKAFALLESAPLVLGPSADGGYYLIGLRDPRIELFNGIAWSTPRVFAQTVERAAEAGLGYRRLPVRRDLDTPADLAAYQTREAISAEFHATSAVLGGLPLCR